ncbi:MAG TPA: glycosyltransferase family 39 protein, partial [Actinoplanes sp.]
MTTLTAPMGSVYRSSHAGATASRGAVRALRPRPGPLLALAALMALHVLALSQQATPLRAVSGLPIAVILPGALALRIIGGRPRRGWDWLLHAIALSLLGLSVVGLILALLPGGALTTVGSLLGLDVLLAVLALGVTLTGRRRVGRPSAAPFAWKRSMVPPPLGLLAITLGAAAVGLAVAGARHLNAGGSPAGVMLAIGVAATALATATVAAGPRGSTAAATTIYLVALAVLLATSLRGTGVTGHDIKIEYRVFTDTLESGSWRPGGLFPGYNSCLSITVLPAFFARLLGIPALDVFRVCFQMLFAVVPVGVYLGARRLLPPPYAVLAAALVLAFPTFVNDMPMLNRQEIALIFFTVLVLNLMESGRARRQQLVMFAVAAVGLTVSHYTSTDVAAQLLLMAWILRRFQQAVRRRRARSHPVPPRPTRAPALGLPAAVLLVAAVGWPLVAGSASAFGETLKSSVASVTAGASAASTSTSYSFFSSPPERTDAEVLDAHLAE